ncbi:membrane protein [Paraliobacillus quinghaiensis]|uniref:Membrane protein n=1 Tax=Paraliobacillus quinghaiensis TaxID=470815 RepID=A0A917TTK5_9BACI|nr:YbaN family protein [Paraliobacillus quinghaiensis]GGM37260.1 membrane protein [Paraliobacillus quinghaiensis]
MKKGLYISGGSIALVLGVLGIILPLLPTTPFLLITAFCYGKSSERLYQWLLNNRVFGNYIKQYQNGQGIPLKMKIIAISMLWITITLSTLFLVPIVLVKILLLVIATSVTIFILSRKTANPLS